MVRGTLRPTQIPKQLQNWIPQVPQYADLSDLGWDQYQKFEQETHRQLWGIEPTPEQRGSSAGGGAGDRLKRKGKSKYKTTEGMTDNQRAAANVKYRQYLKNPGGLQRTHQVTKGRQVMENPVDNTPEPEKPKENLFDEQEPERIEPIGSYGGGASRRDIPPPPEIEEFPEPDLDLPSRNCVSTYEESKLTGLPLCGSHAQVQIQTKKFQKHRKTRSAYHKGRNRNYPF